MKIMVDVQYSQPVNITKSKSSCVIPKGIWWSVQYFHL